MKKSPSSSGSRSKQSVKIKYGNVETDSPKFSKSGGGAAAGSTKEPISRTSSPKTTASKPKMTKSKVKINPQKKPGVGLNISGSSRSTLKSKSSSVTQTSGNSSQTSLNRRTNAQPFPKKGECEVCKQPCRSHCAGCKRVFYCSKQHQQVDWPQHKLVCRPFSIPTQYTSGFHLRPPGVSSTLVSPNSSMGSLGSADTTSPELQFMMATKQINGGGIVFSERPLLITPNILPLKGGNGNEVEKFKPYASQLCSSCFQPIKLVLGKDSNNNNNVKIKIPSCPKCELPLCSVCVMSVSDGSIKNCHPGLGHSPEECAFLKDLQLKSPEVMSQVFTAVASVGNKREEQQEFFLKDLTLLRVLMFRTSCLWRWENLIALRSNPRFVACCKHDFGNMEEWVQGEYPVSNYYFKNICKEKNIQLTDIAKICAIFCEKSMQNSNWLIIYENRTWVPHACSPNTELFYRQIPTEHFTSIDVNVNPLEIIVKAMDNIEEGSKITMNYLQNFEGGRSALAVRLFQGKGLHCCNSECPCYQRGYDKSLGVRCDLFPNSSGEIKVCSGIVSPKVDPPNPERANLGLGIFVKSKKWECDKCTRAEKYSNLHPKITLIAKDLSENCDRCCTTNNRNGLSGNKISVGAYLQFQSKLFSALSNQHWMVWKSKMRIVKTWSDAFGFCSEMLRYAITLPLESPARESMLYVAKQKADMYGGGIYDPSKGSARGKVKHKMELLEFIGNRHGKLSPRRGEMLLDAFYANLILFIEDYKKELPLSPGDSTVKRNQVARECCKKFSILKDILDMCVESLKTCEGTSKMNSGNCQRYLKMANTSLDTIKVIHGQVQKSSTMIIGHLNDLLELYSCQDQKFVTTSLKSSQLRKDPFRREMDDLEFEMDSGNFGPASYSFGVPTSSSAASPISPAATSKFRSNLTAKNPFKANASRFTTFEKGGSTTFSSSSSFPFSTDGLGNTPTDSSDDDDEDNPFIYSGGASFKKKNKTQAQSKCKGKPKAMEEDDWSSYVWFTSDDEDDQEDFNLRYDSSRPAPPPRFGEDLFNDDELEDLAEWAALQFMMGKLGV